MARLWNYKSMIDQHKRDVSSLLFYQIRLWVGVRVFLQEKSDHRHQNQSMDIELMKATFLSLISTNKRDARSEIVHLFNKRENYVVPQYPTIFDKIVVLIHLYPGNQSKSTRPVASNMCLAWW